MPLYEYCCPHCELKFSLLRPFSKADAPATCPECQGQDTRRAISLFASFTKSSDGATTHTAGGGGCAGCASGHCGNCTH